MNKYGAFQQNFIHKTGGRPDLAHGPEFIDDCDSNCDDVYVCVCKCANFVVSISWVRFVTILFQMQSREENL